MEDRTFGRRYRVTEKLGSGGMADVYKAVDEVLGRTVAVKVLHAHYSDDPSFVARFRQEAQAAANLSHPTIVNIYDWGKDDDTYFIVMEYVRGTDLKTLVRDHGPAEPLKAAAWAEQVCKALAVAHGYGVIHRDIKPQNIVLMPDGSIKVMDFGIARAGDSSMTQTGSVLGTAHYISPEQAQGKPLTPASDLYSLGVVLYELVTGKLPFTAEDPVSVALKHVNEPPIPPKSIRPSVPQPLEDIILKAMSKNPAERYQSADEMRADLHRYLSGDAVVTLASDETAVLPTGAAAAGVAGAARAARNARPAPASRQRARWPVVVALILAAVALGLLAAWALGAFGGGTVSVPDLADLTHDQAQATLKAQSLVLGSVDTTPNADVAKGLVVTQNPSPGTRLSKGAAVNIVVSSGVPSLAVPDVTGKSESDALRLLQEAGFRVGTRPESSDTVAEGLVIRQNPAGGASAEQGSLVGIVVSTGKATTAVPDVLGKGVSKATAALKAAGFKVSVTEVFDETTAKGIVTQQDPSPGVPLTVGSQVRLTVSKGTEFITIPDVTGKSEGDARTQLTGLGFLVSVDYIASPDAGVVLGQEPLPGAKAKKGDSIKLTVGQASPTP